VLEARAEREVNRVVPVVLRISGRGVFGATRRIDEHNFSAARAAQSNGTKMHHALPAEHLIKGRWTEFQNATPASS
jgi:hypothetical protein